MLEQSKLYQLSRCWCRDGQLTRDQWEGGCRLRREQIVRHRLPFHTVLSIPLKIENYTIFAFGYNQRKGWDRLGLSVPCDEAEGAKTSIFLVINDEKQELSVFVFLFIFFFLRQTNICLE